MAALIFSLHKTMKGYINSAENRNLVMEIGSEVLDLTRAVVKKHTLERNKAFQYYLAQPARMLFRTVLQWNKAFLRKMRRKPCTSRPWTILVTWNFPKEVFDCLKVAISSKETGGYVAKTTHCIKQIYMVNMDRLQNFFLPLPNKYAKILDERYIIVKEEKEGSYSRVIVDKEHPAVFRYRKHRHISHTFLLKIFGSNRGCGLIWEHLDTMP